MLLLFPAFESVQKKPLLCKVVFVRGTFYELGFFCRLLF